MAQDLQRSTGRSSEYTFDRGGMPAEMGPYIGIVVNNVDNTRSGRLQVWIEQFGATNVDGTPNLTDPTLWRTVRYITPFYGATKQSGENGVGTYPGNRNTYGMWFTPPELGTKVLCFFVGGDPSVGGYYLGCIPEDGMNRMIPAIGAVSNYQPNNANQTQLLNGATAAPVTEINDISKTFADDPRFFDKPKPVQSTVEGVLFQQGLQKDPIRGPIGSSAQRESPSNCYGIATPGKPIYQGGYNEKTFRQALEKGQVKLQDIAVIGRQGGHTLVMDDGDIDGKDTLIRIRTAKGHQITMSDDGDAFFITHANGQTWIELGKAGTVDVFSTNSINLRSQGVLNFHADKGINMYSGGTFRIKAKKTAIMESGENLLLGSDKYTLLSSKQTLGISSTGTLALESKVGTWKTETVMNFKAKLINLNGAKTVPAGKMPALNNLTLADTEYVAGQGWVIKQGALETIVSRAPTHQPYAGSGKGADVSINLNPIEVAVPSSSVSDVYEQAAQEPVQNPVTVDKVLEEPVAPANIGPLSTSEVTVMTAQTAQNVASKYPAYDDDGNLMPGFELNEENEAVYVGTALGSTDRGVGVYGQSVTALVGSGLVKSSALNLIQSGVSPDLVLKSADSWTGQYGIDGIGDYLNSRTLQNIVQFGIMAAAFTGLTNSGAITGNESPKVVATLLQPATEYGVSPVVAWVDGFADTQDVVNLKVAARQGQYAVDFSNLYGQELNLINTPPDGTIAQRGAIDQAIADIIDNPKVPIPQYTDIPVEIVDGSETQIQADGSLLRVAKPTTTNEDGIVRFAPGSTPG